MDALNLLQALANLSTAGANTINVNVNGLTMQCKTEKIYEGPGKIIKAGDEEKPKVNEKFKHLQSPYRRCTLVPMTLKKVKEELTADEDGVVVAKHDKGYIKAVYENQHPGIYEAINSAEKLAEEANGEFKGVIIPMELGGLKVTKVILPKDYYVRDRETGEINTNASGEKSRASFLTIVCVGGESLESELNRRIKQIKDDLIDAPERADNVIDTETEESTTKGKK